MPNCHILRYVARKQVTRQKGNDTHTALRVCPATKLHHGIPTSPISNAITLYFHLLNFVPAIYISSSGRHGCLCIFSYLGPWGAAKFVEAFRVKSSTALEYDVVYLLPLK